MNRFESFCDEFFRYLHWLFQKAENDMELRRLIQTDIIEIINIMGRYINRRNRKTYIRYMDIKEEFRRLIDISERMSIDGNINE